MYQLVEAFKTDPVNLRVEPTNGDIAYFKANEINKSMRDACALERAVVRDFLKRVVLSLRPRCLYSTNLDEDFDSVADMMEHLFVDDVSDDIIYFEGVEGVNRYDAPWVRVVEGNGLDVLVDHSLTLAPFMEAMERSMEPFREAAGKK